MSTSIQFLTPDDIGRRRVALLAEARAEGIEQLRAQRDQGLLDVEAQGLLDELEDLAYLDGDD